jgi:hypothetical protein
MSLEGYTQYWEYMIVSHKLKTKMEIDIYTKERLVEIENSISKAKGKFKEDLKNVRIYGGIAIACVIVLAFHYSHIFTLPTWIAVILWIAGLFFGLAILGTDLNKSKAEIDGNESIKNVFLGLPEPSTDTDRYFEKLVKINVENLAAYYTLVKVHTSQSFRVSLIVGILGFILLILGLALGFQFEQYRNISFIASGAGIIIEFISGVLFFLYNKTVIQLKDYHDSLIDVQNVLLSFKLIENTQDEKLKAEMIGKMIEYLVKNR